MDVDTNGADVAGEAAGSPGRGSDADDRTRAGVRSVRVLLLRHGQSEWNAVRRWQGTADSPLSPLGREQAAETAEALASMPVRFGSLWSSDLARAFDTAAVIGARLGLGTPRVDPRLREAHAGEWEGLTPDEIEAGWPGWLADHRRPPSFEPYHDVVERTMAALGDIAADVAAALDGGGAALTPLVIAHSGVIRSVVRHLGRDDDRVPNLGGVWLSLDVAPAAGSATAAPAVDVPAVDVPAAVVLDLFDPAGIVISGVDAPGEDPGDEPDEADAHRRAEH
jgi:broad specificity phosphatase PhoE